MAATVTSKERVALVADLELETAQRAAAAVAMAALETRDESTAEHCDDVLTLCDAIGRRLGFSDEQHKYLLAGAQLHDIGKVGIPLSILNKSGPLTDAEWAVIREHTLIGERILRSVPAMAEVAKIVRHSHEHWDGSGYPDGLSGEDIPLPSRVILCADAFHAMRSDRPYRRGRDVHAALAEIEACAGTQFDPRVAEALVALAGDAQAGVPVKSDKLRRRRLIVLLSALVIGAGAALAAAPDVRDSIKSIFASVPPTHAAAEPSARTGYTVGAFEDLLRLPPLSPQQVAQSEQPGRSQIAPRVAGARGERQRGRRDTRRELAPRRERAHSAPSRPPHPSHPGERAAPPASTLKTGVPGRALGKDVPVPRRPDTSPSDGEGGRTDPPALGREAGPANP